VTGLDPTLPSYWIELSSAAAFAGNDKLAESSLQKAIALRRDGAYAYAWGLDLYSPRWLDDEAKRAKIARMAARERYGSSHDRLHVGEALYQADWPDLALQVLRGSE